MTREKELLSNAYEFPLNSRGKGVFERNGRQVCQCVTSYDACIIVTALNEIMKLAEMQADAEN